MMSYNDIVVVAAAVVVLTKSIIVFQRLAWTELDIPTIMVQRYNLLNCQNFAVSSKYRVLFTVCLHQFNN